MDSSISRGWGWTIFGVGEWELSLDERGGWEEGNEEVKGGEGEGREGKRSLEKSGEVEESYLKSPQMNNQRYEPSFSRKGIHIP